MAKRGKDKKPGKEKGKAAGEPACDLEASPPPPGTGGRAGILESVRGSRYLQILILLTVAGAILRLWQLGAASLWLDEASTLTWARMSLAQIWGSMSGGEFEPPLFYWAEHAMLVFGESEVVLRLVPAILGILTIPVFYLIGAEILDRNTGILAAALLTFSPFGIYYSQEARAYAMMLFFFALALLFLLRFLRTSGKRDAILFGAFSALAFWSHFYAFVFILTLFIILLAVKAREMARDPRAAFLPALAILAFALLSLPILYYAVQLFGQITAKGHYMGVQGLDTITQTLLQISGFSGILAWALTLLFTAGVASLFMRDRAKGLLLAFALVFPLLMSIVLSYHMPMMPRYLICLLPAFFPGVAASLRPVCPLFRSRNLVYGALILAFLVNLPALYPYYTTPQKDDWRGLAGALNASAGPGDLIIAAPGYNRQPLDYYYQNESEGTLEFGIYQVGEAEGLVASRPNSTAWFIVTGDIQVTDPQGLLLSWLGQHTRLVWRDANSGILLLKYSG